MGIAEFEEGIGEGAISGVGALEQEAVVLTSLEVDFEPVSVSFGEEIARDGGADVEAAAIGG